MAQTKAKIQLLPEHLIDQIKAGEIIERPASLVKEILENAIDAKASRIELYLVNNGLDLIQCHDNGKGMSFDDLPMAFCRHATSKIERYEDLYALRTFGFRGEALASIASISRLICNTLPSQKDSIQEGGGKIEIHGGQTILHTPFKSQNPGTTLTVKDLFYNTPARLKFVRSKTSEKNSLKRIINSFLLANPQIQFSIRWDEKEKVLFPKVENLEKRITQIFFKKKEAQKEIHYFEGSYEDHRVHGWFSKYSQKGNAGKHHFLFANTRLFNDRQLHQNLLKTLEDFWPPGEVGHYLCFIEAPKELIDVNVHPNKIQIKFFKQSLVHSLLHGSIKSSLEKIKTSTSEEVFFSKTKDNPQVPHEEFLQKFSLEANANFTGPSGTLDGESETNRIQILSNRFYLERIEEGWLLNDLGLIFSHYLKKILINPTSEFEITPLLISEPFSLNENWNAFLNELKLFGFDFERINTSTVLLKTIPKALDYFEPAPILKEFFTDTSTPPQSLKSFFKNRLKHPFAPQGLRPTQAVRQAFHQVLGENVLSQYQKILDDSTLTSLLYSSKQAFQTGKEKGNPSHTASMSQMTSPMFSDLKKPTSMSTKEK